MLQNQQHEKAKIIESVSEQLDAAEASRKTFKHKFEVKCKSETLLVAELEAERLKSVQSPADSVPALRAQLARAENSRAELAGVLLKILRREGLSSRELMQTSKLQDQAQLALQER